MPRICWLVVLLATAGTVAEGQTCARAKQINDTSQVMALLKTTFTPDSTVAEPAWRQLRSLDSTAVPALLALMCGDTKSFETMGLPIRAGGVLSRLGPPGIRALVRAVADSDDAVASNAVLALSPWLGETDATAEVLPLFSDARPKVRGRAAELVRFDGPARQAAIAAMAGALADSDFSVRQSAAGRLFTMGPEAKPLVPELIRAVRDPVARVRHEAALAMGRTETTDTAAIAALSKIVIQDSDSDVRAAGARALGWLGAGAVRGVPALIASLGDRNEAVRAEAAEALGHIGADSVAESRDSILAALSRSLMDRDSVVRSSAADALREIGVPAATHQVQGLQNQDPRVRITAARALGEQSPTPQAIDALISLLRDPASQVREEAVSALGGFGPVVEQRMRTLLQGSDQVTKRGANQVLQYLRNVGRLPVADGCYDLSLAPWKPNLGLGEDTIFSTPPMTVRFSRVKSFGFGSYGGRLSFRVVPANRAKTSVHGPGYWTPVAGADSVSIVWTTGFSGLTMKLAVTRDTLRGVAETFWDFPRPEQTSQVTGTRTPCK